MHTAYKMHVAISMRLSYIYVVPPHRHCESNQDKIYCTYFVDFRVTLYSGIRTNCKLRSLQTHEYVSCPDVCNVPSHYLLAKDAVKNLSRCQYIICDTLCAKYLKTTPNAPTELRNQNDEIEKRARLRMGLNQKTLAHKANISVISRVCRGSGYVFKNYEFSQ